MVRRKVRKNDSRKYAIVEQVKNWNEAILIWYNKVNFFQIFIKICLIFYRTLKECGIDIWNYFENFDSIFFIHKKSWIGFLITLFFEALCRATFQTSWIFLKIKLNPFENNFLLINSLVGFFEIFHKIVVNVASFQ